MFDATIFHRDTDDELVKETFEGVVDLKTFPTSKKARLEFADDEKSDVTVPLRDVHIESPLK